MEGKKERRKERQEGKKERTYMGGRRYIKERRKEGGMFRKEGRNGGIKEGRKTGRKEGRGRYTTGTQASTNKYTWQARTGKGENKRDVGRNGTEGRRKVAKE
jgi:hypothetical protein